MPAPTMSTLRGPPGGGPYGGGGIFLGFGFGKACSSQPLLSKFQRIEEPGWTKQQEKKPKTRGSVTGARYPGALNSYMIVNSHESGAVLSDTWRQGYGLRFDLLGPDPSPVFPAPRRPRQRPRFDFESRRNRYRAQPDAFHLGKSRNCISRRFSGNTKRFVGSWHLRAQHW